MRFDEVAGDVEAEPEPRALARRIATLVGREELLDAPVRHARAVVPHREASTAAPMRSRTLP